MIFLRFSHVLQYPVCLDQSIQTRKTIRYFFDKQFLLFSECGNIVNNVECYDCSTRKWHDLAPMIIPRKFVGTAVLDDQLYAIGGINGQYGDLVTTEACNLTTNQWISLPSLEECKGH